MLKKYIKSTVDNLTPSHKKLFLRYMWKYLNKSLDQEMFYVNNILKTKRRFLDIGSNAGIYSYFFSQHFNNIDAFEPLSEVSYPLKSLKNEKLTVHNVALSNKNGHLDFYIPIIDNTLEPNLASLEKRKPPHDTRTVDVKTLDQYNFLDVDLIKIDVEGHENKVIMGSIDTLKTSSPVLIVEIEQRHISNPIDEVFNIIVNLGYKGFFLTEGHLASLSTFSYERNQKPYLSNVLHNNYVNNFIFLPRD